MKKMIQTIGGVPLLLVYRDQLKDAMNMGTVFFFHGLTASKDIQYPDLCRLAEAGFLVIGLDNWGHGDRRIPDFEEYFDLDSPDFQPNYLKAILNTSGEIPMLIDALTNEKMIDPGRIGIAGISLGAIIGYRVMVIEPRVRAAALINGSPEWAIDLPESPHHHLQAFYPKALLSIVAAKDTLVPPVHARRLHQNLSRFYSPAPEKLKLMEFPESEHFMRGEDWDAAFHESIRWFKQHL
jgi:hypothetical protein